MLIVCTSCNATMRGPDSVAGKRVKCPKCAAIIDVPKPEGEPAPPPPVPEPPEPDVEQPANVSKKSTSSVKKPPPVPSKTASPDDEDDSDADEDRPRHDDDDDRDAPRKRRRDEDDDDDEDEERGRRTKERRRDDDLLEHRSIRRSGEKPGKVTNIGVLALVGGIVGILVAITWIAVALLTGLGGLFAGCPCGCLGLLWPGIYYSVVAGILAIIKGASLLGANAPQNAPPIYIGILLIINVINGDVVCLVLGILILVFCGDDEVKAYLAR